MGTVDPYPPTYAGDDDRRWRDGYDPETVTGGEWFFGQEGGDRRSYNHEVMQVSEIGPL